LVLPYLLNGLFRTSGIIVNLASSFAALIRPREVQDRNHEEAVAGIGETSESVVPSEESREDAEHATGLDSADAWCAVIEVEVADTKAEEGEVKREEEREEHDR
jgi:hypothetical protein